MLSKKHWLAFRIPLLLSFLWCAFMVALFVRGSESNAMHCKDQALIQARTLYTQVLDTRAWNSEHGGVYVFESAYGVPNIWIPEEQRTLALPDGKKLVLVNPAYMSRQISERTSMKGASFRITSHEPLRPENASDMWETTALTACISGAPEVFARVSDAKGERFRYMAALRTQASCMGCHPENRIGDVRGGISVSLDAKPFLRDVAEQNKSLMMAFGLMGLAGSLCIIGLSSFFHRRRMLAEERERMKSAFMANMSHDMRTPLTGILGMTDLLARNAKKPEDRAALQYLHLAGTALLEIVSDITDYAALDTGKVELSEKVFDLHVALARCLDLFRPQCLAKGLYLRLEVGEDVPHYLHGDEFRLRQALGNLLSNAAKFTSQGGIMVRVARLATVQEGQVGWQKVGTASLALRFEIIDTGPGIAANEQQRIFERFERGSSAVQSGLTGTGLGLSIALDIAHRMHGSIKVLSEPDKGACFSLILQFKHTKYLQGDLCHPEATTWVPFTAQSDKIEGIARGARVLLAEDNAVTAHYVTEVLQQGGHYVRAAHNGQEALDMLQQAPADILLLDMRMPGMDGMATIRALQDREKEGTHKTPIVVMSASVLSEEKRELAAAGVEVSLLKPVPAADLLRIVREHALCYTQQTSYQAPQMERVSPSRAVGRTQASEICQQQEGACSLEEHEGAKAATGHKPLFDEKAALDALDGSRVLLRSLVAVWLAESQQQKEDLMKAHASGDVDSVRRLAHAIKNSAGTLHLPSLRALATMLEEGNEGTRALRMTELTYTLEATVRTLQNWLAWEGEK